MAEPNSSPAASSETPVNLHPKPQPRFLESTLDALESLGVPDERIHRESYG
ncbi:MAG TPA: hypothetical protein VKK31_17730 [Thermoanaerobaculia bacterium]|nr:hypothetical protein [Thermoanaerobaculia bacterium]